MSSAATHCYVLCVVRNSHSICALGTQVSRSLSKMGNLEGPLQSDGLGFLQGNRRPTPADKRKKPDI